LLAITNSEIEARILLPTAAGPPISANLEIVAQLNACFADVENQNGSLDAWCNNSALFTRFDPLILTEPIGLHSFGESQGVFFLGCQQVARLMWKNRLAARSSHHFARLHTAPGRSMPTTAASQSGVIMLTRALARAFAHPFLNSVAPRRDPVR